MAFYGGAAALGQVGSDIGAGQVSGQNIALERQRVRQQMQLAQQAMQLAQQRRATEEQQARAPRFVQTGYDKDGNPVAVFANPMTGEFTYTPFPLSEGEVFKNAVNVGSGKTVIMTGKGNQIHKSLVDTIRGEIIDLDTGDVKKLPGHEDQGTEFMDTIEPIIKQMGSEQDQAMVRSAARAQYLVDPAKAETIATWVANKAAQKAGDVDIPVTAEVASLTGLEEGSTVRLSVLADKVKKLAGTSQTHEIQVPDAQGNIRLVPARTSTQPGLGRAGAVTPPGQPPAITPRPPARPGAIPSPGVVGAPGAPSPVRPSAPGAPTPAQPGRLVGHRPLGAAQQEKIGQQNVALASAIDQIGIARKDIGVLTSMSSAGKIKMATDTDALGEKLVVRTVAQLSPKEQEAAAAWQQLAEHINLLRGPMASTGFRGPEAFAALQAMRGQLMAPTGITYRVLTNTEGIMRKFMDVNNQMLSTGNVSPAAVPPPVASPEGEAMMGGGGATTRTPTTPGAPPPDKIDQLLDKLLEKYQ